MVYYEMADFIRTIGEPVFRARKPVFRAAARRAKAGSRRNGSP